MLSRKMFSKSRSVLQIHFRLESTNSEEPPYKPSVDLKRIEFFKRQDIQHHQRTVVVPGWNDALPFDQVPGPKPMAILGKSWRFLPIIGDFSGLDPKGLMETLWKEFGGIFTIRGTNGKPPTLYLNDAKDIQRLYRYEGPWPTHGGFPSHNYYRRVLRKDMFQNVGGVFTLQGQQWYEFRTVINPILLKPKNVMLYVDKMSKVADQLVDNISYLASKDKNREMPDNFLREIYKWSVESIGLVTLDRHLGCMDKNLNRDSEINKLIDAGIEVMDLTYELDVMPSFITRFTNKAWTRFVDTMDTMTSICFRYIYEAKDRIEKSANTDAPEEDSMLRQLLALDPRIAVVTALDMLVAGVDTTGRVLGATLYFLARFPEKQAELRNEVNKLLPSKNSPVTPSILDKANYLKAVIKETTRMSPIGMGVMRTTTQNLVLGGYQVPKGTHVITNNLLASLDEVNFIRPKEFLPERWLRTTTGDLSYKNANPFASLPFGFGPRSCIGRRIAKAELEIAVLKIIRNFELSWHRKDMHFSGKLLYGISAPLNVRVTPVE